MNSGLYNRVYIMSLVSCYMATMNYINMDAPNQSSSESVSLAISSSEDSDSSSFDGYETSSIEDEVFEAPEDEDLPGYVNEASIRWEMSEVDSTQVLVEDEGVKAPGGRRGIWIVVITLLILMVIFTIGFVFRTPSALPSTRLQTPLAEMENSPLETLLLVI